MVASGVNVAFSFVESLQMALAVIKRNEIDGGGVSESSGGQLAVASWRSIWSAERCVCVEGCVMLGGPGGC